MEHVLPKAVSPSCQQYSVLQEDPLQGLLLEDIAGSADVCFNQEQQEFDVSRVCCNQWI